MRNFLLTLLLLPLLAASCNKHITSQPASQQTNLPAQQTNSSNRVETKVSSLAGWQDVQNDALKIKFQLPPAWTSKTDLTLASLPPPLGFQALHFYNPSQSIALKNAEEIAKQSGKKIEDFDAYLNSSWGIWVYKRIGDLQDQIDQSQKQMLAASGLSKKADLNIIKTTSVIGGATAEVFSVPDRDNDYWFKTGESREGNTRTINYYFEHQGFLYEIVDYFSENRSDFDQFLSTIQFLN